MHHFVFFLSIDIQEGKKLKFSFCFQPRRHSLACQDLPMMTRETDSWTEPLAYFMPLVAFCASEIFRECRKRPGT